MLPEDVENSFSVWRNFSKKVVSGKSLVVFDRAQDFLFGFCSEPGQGGDLACFACSPQITEGAHLKLIVQSPDLFGSKALQFKKFKDSLRKFVSEILVKI